MLTFILVPGHNTSKSHDLVMRSGWKELLRNEFVGSQVKIYYSHYDMFNESEVTNSIDGLAKIISETEGHIVLLSYSFGGFISRLAIQQLPPEEHQKIQALVTMGTPFQVPNMRQRKFLHRFSLLKAIDVPILALGGYLDPYAFPFFMRPVAPKVATKNFWCTHRDFFFSGKTRKSVLVEMKKFLEVNLK